MRFALLGPVQVCDEEGCRDVRGLMPRTVLALLLLNAGKIVSVDQMAEVVWDGRPPASATASLHNHVARLRRTLGPAVAGRIGAVPGYYRITLEPGELDVDRFTELCGLGRRAARESRWAESSRDLGAALALWRGRPLADVPGLDRMGFVQEFLESRALAWADRVEADLRLGRHQALLGELRGLTVEYPLQEVFRAQLMTALYRSGRQAESLDVFLGFRRALVEDLGVEPSAELCRLHQRILRADPDLAAPSAPVPVEQPESVAGRSRPGAPEHTQYSAVRSKRSADPHGETRRPAARAGNPSVPAPAPDPASAAGSAAKSPAAAVPARAADPEHGAEPAALIPAQLPADLFDFTGRKAEVKTLCDLLLPSPGADEPTLVAAVTGAGGVGKSALAIHAAHRVAEFFPDGQLYVDLRGLDAEPREPGEVLADLLRDLGVPVRSVPRDLTRRSALFRTVTSGKRLLIVLDDAGDAAQLRPLLPGSGTCRVLVTSRATLPGLAAAALVNLEPLRSGEALDLFTAVIGGARVRAEQESVDQVLGYCAGLPLAVRIAAARLAVRPSWTVADLAGRLADERRRLDELRVQDITVRAVFELSYAHLDNGSAHSLSSSGSHAIPSACPPHYPAGPVGQARAFRLLGLFPGPDLTAHAAAALFGQPLSQAEDLLESLVDASLLEAPAPGRYRFHGLLRTYAAERAEDEESAEARDAALRRVIAWYAYACRHAVERLETFTPGKPAAPVPPAQPELEFTRLDQALAWFAAERINILAMVHLADAVGFAAATWQIPDSALYYHHLRAHWSDWLEACTIGLRNARVAQDDRAQISMLNALGFVHALQGQGVLGIEEASEALAIAKSIGDPRYERASYDILGSIARFTHRFEQGIEWLQQAVRLGRQFDELGALALSLGHLGLCLVLAGRHEEALQYCAEAVALSRRESVRYMQAAALEGLGEVYLATGRVDEAFGALRESVEIARMIGDQPTEADSLEHLGDAYQLVGDSARAREAWTRAVAVYEACGHPWAESVRARLQAPAAAASAAVRPSA
ncbi:MAG TPA: BTAD domain-containing putative transcriptional regulator [Actinocrinis sp.]|nr:BTAD domain-containing putative transcriptional regulator [Actinocrinis sp.]